MAYKFQIINTEITHKHIPNTSYVFTCIAINAENTITVFPLQKELENLQHKTGQEDTSLQPVFRPENLFVRKNQT